MTKISGERDRDLDREPATLAGGTVLDEAGAQAWAEEILARVPRPGRPSLGSLSSTSPKVQARLSRELHEAVLAAAREEGVSPSEFIREALAERVARRP